MAADSAIEMTVVISKVKLLVHQHNKMIQPHCNWLDNNCSLLEQKSNMRIDNGGDDPFATPMGSVNGEPSMEGQ